ncbi:MAG: peptide chain release factor N(5)-glutamine methyltransferase [Planctomycetes bacterium]|nr:peptide chain release factor N(5)-glutamine methyltransferase [Planctomycetota bacterium]
MAPETLALLEVLRRTTEFLKSKGCDSPRLESELLLAKALAVKRLDLYLQFDRPLSETELAACRELVKRRGAREPMAYILGEKEFRSLAFEVNPDVFIPRPDTEAVVEAVVAFLKNTADVESLQIADIGTGSGCLAVSIAVECRHARVHAVDISPRALAVAARNAARHGVEARVEFVESEYLDRVEPGRRFHAIVCNPPYVLSDELSQLQPELTYEPRMALSPPGDAMGEVFARIARTAAERLLVGGAVFVEIGEGQGVDLEKALGDVGIVNCRRVKDMSGAERVVVGIHN